MSYYFQKQVKKTERNAYYFEESSGYRRYVNEWDVIKRNIPYIFTNLPRELNNVIWHFKSQLECIDKRWGSFIMSLTAIQHIVFIRAKRRKDVYTRPRHYIIFALNNFHPKSRIYNKALRQLWNY